MLFAVVVFILFNDARVSLSSTYWFVQAEHLVKPVCLEFMFHLWTRQHPQAWFTGQVSPFALVHKQHRKLSSMVQMVVRDENVPGKFIVG